MQPLFIIIQSAGEGHFSRYARTLQTTLDYLRTQDLEAGNIYIKALRSQLSASELQLIYFLCFDSKWGWLKVLVEYFGLLAHLNAKSTGAGADYDSFFNRSAFLEG